MRSAVMAFLFLISGLFALEDSNFKNRLDIHFGIVAISEHAEMWDLVAAQLDSVLTTSVQINNKWTWGPVGTMDGEPKDFMLDNIQQRISKFFYLQNPNTDKSLVSLSEKMIQLYPDCIYGYSNMAAMHLTKKKYSKAKEYYKEALKIDPNDEIVLGNLKYIQEVQKQMLDK